MTNTFSNSYSCIQRWQMSNIVCTNKYSRTIPVHKQICTEAADGVCIGIFCNCHKTITGTFERSELVNIRFHPAVSSIAPANKTQ